MVLVPLSALGRFYIYGLHSFAAEVTYTAIWHLCLDGNKRLQGYTHVPVFFMYGLVMLGQEWLYARLRHRCHILVRGLVYMLWVFLNEFVWGAALKQFDLHGWDYEPSFTYHIYGVITLEYAPLWYLSTIVSEQFVVKRTWRLYYEEFE